MADATTERAIAISTGVAGALNATDALQSQSAGSRAREAALAGGIVNALSAAGLLRDEPTAPPPGGKAPQAPEPQAGDVHTVQILRLLKTVKPDSVKFELDNPRRRDLVAGRPDPFGTQRSYELDFPADDKVFLPEFDRLLTIGIDPPLSAFAALEITGKISTLLYAADVTEFNLYRHIATSPY